jgi:pyruvate dehydrogenase E2 component (dihydrolipoamide acetyltransferase)
MATEIKMRSLGKMKSVDVLQVKVKAGDVVAKNQPLLEIESEKGTADFPSPFAGKITQVMVKPNDQVASGQVLFHIETSDILAAAPTESKPAAAAKPAPAKAAPAPAPPQRIPAEAIPTPAKNETPARPAAPAAPAPSRPDGDGLLVRAGPATRKLARRLGVDLSKVRGSGKDGRVTEADVEHYVKQRLTAAPTGAPGLGLEVPELPDFEEFGPVEGRPLSKVRKATAGHMALCWNLIPHVTQHDEADVTDLEAFRQQQKTGGVKLTMTAFALKASAIALKQFPEFNSSLDLNGGRLIVKHYYHIGVAVDTENGLLVPVIRDVDKKSIEELARELAEAAERARQGKADMSGGTFTISNLGGIGGTAFTPIVNWPEVAILGLSRSKQVPVWKDGQWLPRLMMPLSLSYDHRVIDGAAAARFTRFLAEMLQNPWKMLLHA